MNSDELLAAEISQRIQQLESLGVENLKGEMQQLKRSLIENPAACLLLKDEDIGTLVASLRKITGVAIASAASSTKTKGEKKTAVKALSATELAKVLAEAGDDF